MAEYFERLQKDFEKAYGIATEARKTNWDPAPEVEIIPAKDVAAPAD
jgi:hypothetical protein